jgi:hypothetical protein
MTSDSQEVSPEPPEVESTTAVANERRIEMEVTSASVNLAKAPCKCACANSNSTGSTLKCLFSYHSFSMKLRVFYGGGGGGGFRKKFEFYTSAKFLGKIGFGFCGATL